MRSPSLRWRTSFRRSPSCGMAHVRHSWRRRHVVWRFEHRHGTVLMRDWAHGFAVGCIAMVDGSAALCRPRSHNLRIACVFHWEVVFDLNPFCCTGLEPQCAGVRNSTVQQCVSDIATMLSASLGAAQLLGVGQSGPCLRVLRTNSSRFFPRFRRVVSSCTGVR